MTKGKGRSDRPKVRKCMRCGKEYDASDFLPKGRLCVNCRRADEERQQRILDEGKYMLYHCRYCGHSFRKSMMSEIGGGRLVCKGCREELLAYTVDEIEQKCKAKEFEYEIRTLMYKLDNSKPISVDEAWKVRIWLERKVSAGDHLNLHDRDLLTVMRSCLDAKKEQQ